MKKLIAIILMFQFASISVFAREWGMEDLTDKARTESYDTKKSFEKLYQARRNVTRKVGGLVPSLNLGVIMNSITSVTGTFFLPISIIAPLIGFIFPANWFELKESKLMFEAEKRFFISAVANNINSVEAFYLEANKTMQAIRLYEAVYADVDTILKTVLDQEETNPIPFTAYAKLDLLKNRMEAEIEVMREIYWTQIEEIGHSIGLNEQERREFILKELKNFDPKLNSFTYNDIREKVLSRAVEINAGKYLSLASEFAIKKRKWEFLSPNPDPESSMGLGYSAQVNIAKSEKRVLDLELKEFEERFMTQIELVARDHAVTKKNIANAEKIRATAKRFYDLARAKLDFSQSKDYKEIAEASIEYMQAELELMNLKHQMLAVESSYRRLLYQGKAYEKLLPTLWLKSPEEKLSKVEKKENRKINKAIKKGEIVLPADEFLSDNG